MFPSTAAHSLEEDERAREEHIFENTSVFSEICSEPGSTGASSTGTTAALRDANSTRSSSYQVGRDALLDPGAFSALRDWLTDEIMNEQEEEALMSLPVVGSSMTILKLYGVLNGCLSSRRISTSPLHASTIRTTRP